MRLRNSALCAAVITLALAHCSRTGIRVDHDDAGTPCATPCDDGVFCNGLEQCDAKTGLCVAAKLEVCDDEDECTVDRCEEAAAACVYQERPRDEDGDGFDACEGDCDDGDATIHPGAEELCDEIDQDCDEAVDENLLSECMDCRPGCRLIYLPPEGEVWEPTEDNSSAVERGPDGDLVLNSQSNESFDAWIANYFEGTITRIDTRDGTQIGRYHSVLNDGTNGAEPAADTCGEDLLDDNDGGNCPSRTAVDLNGAVYVANRAFGRQGTVTKIAGFKEDCVDRNNDGEIQTSNDVNGSGTIDLFVEGEFLGQDDECLVWTVDTGGDDSKPRALAVAADGTVWVGLNGEERVMQLDPATGKVLDSVAVPGFEPYGAAIDSKGVMWMTEALSGTILSVDTKTKKAGKVREAPSPEAGCPSSYGIAVDTEDRVWIAGFSCPYAFGFDQAANKWRSVPLPESGITRGIAADDRGRIFLASSFSWIKVNADSRFGFIETSDPIARLTVFNAKDGGGMKVFGTTADPLPGGGAIGVGLDSNGRAWLVNQNTETATRVDPDTGEAKQFSAGSLPYTYSDFTGFALRRITAPTGFIREVVEGCPVGPSEWETLRWDANVPSAATIQVRLRSAATREALDGASWFGPWKMQPADLLTSPGPLPEERFLEVEARLVSGDMKLGPALQQIVIQLHCPI